MARPAAAIVWTATLWSDLSMQCPESDRAQTGGKAWRWAHNLTSSKVIAFYAPSSFSLLYAGSLRRLNTCRTDPFPAFSIHPRPLSLAEIGRSTGTIVARTSIHSEAFSRGAHAAHRVGPCDSDLPLRRQHAGVEVDVTTRQAHRVGYAHACHRDQSEQGYVSSIGAARRLAAEPALPSATHRSPQ